MKMRFLCIGMVLLSGAFLLHRAVSCAAGYKGAGILPYTINPVTGVTEVLLSREVHGSSTGKWSDFGGSRDWFEYDAQETALREYCEESNEICGCYDKMKACLKEPTTYRLEENGYVMFLVQVEYRDDYAAEFQKKLATATTFCQKEKDLLIWAPIDLVFKSCKDGTTCSVGKEKITLRNCFMQLCKGSKAPFYVVSEVYSN